MSDIVVVLRVVELIDEDSFEAREKKLRAKHLFFIVTKMDTIKKVQERAEVRGTIQNQLKLWEIDCATNYVEVNAKSALECTRCVPLLLVAPCFVAACHCGKWLPGRERTGPRGLVWS